MPISPLARQLLVAGSTNLAALSVGGVIAYPSVLLQQLQSNDTIIQLDLHNKSWIGSVHGLAGIPSILLPLLMQYIGRKWAFILSCIFITIGWALTCTAQNITILLIGESFHGLGGHSLLISSALSVTEMLQPKYRNPSQMLYATFQACGISSIGILGQYLNWRTVALIMSSPILLAVPIGCIWLESPYWLAWKGKFKECEQNFERLRGNDEDSQKELKLLLKYQKGNIENMKTKVTGALWLRNLRKTLNRRDFRIPALHNMILLSVMYWGGGMPVIIYSTDMIIKSSGKPNPQVKLAMDILLFIGYNIASVLVRYFSTKKVLLICMGGSAVLMISASVITFLQSLGIVPEDSELAVYCLAGFITVVALGAGTSGFCLSSEVMPVKHRGIGGGLFVLCTCVYHASSLKSYPYLCLYINVWGVFLMYAVHNAVGIIIIWKYVPETWNRTLQEIENYYNYGSFTKNNDTVDVPFIKYELK